MVDAMAQMSSKGLCSWAIAIFMNASMSVEDLGTKLKTQIIEPEHYGLARVTWLIF